jgi:hypothetical protein
LETPRECFLSAALRNAFQADANLCLQLTLHLIRWLESLPKAKRLLLQETRITLPNGHYLEMGFSTADEISLYMLRQHGVKASASLINKYIRRLHFAAPAIFDAYYRIRLLSSNCSKEGRRKRKTTSLILFNAHELSAALESLPDTSSEIIIKCPMQGQKELRHRADGRGDEASPVAISISAS